MYDKAVNLSGKNSKLYLWGMEIIPADICAHHEGEDEKNEEITAGPD